MVKDNTETITSSKKDVKLIHVQVIGGTQADIYEIGKAMKTFKNGLPFQLEALVTNDKVELRDVDSIIRELQKLQAAIEKKKVLGE